MTDAPEKIWTWGYTGENMRSGGWYYCKAGAIAPYVEYTRTDLADAIVTAAYEAAAEYILQDLNAVIAESGDKSPEIWQMRQDAKEIRALTPADAQAALEQAIAGAAKAEREACHRDIRNAPHRKHHVAGMALALQTILDRGERHGLE